jgi:hypothetical protein
MGGLIDAARQTRDDDKTGLAESRASWPANVRPAPEALREPTIAIIGRIDASSAPRRPSKGGASSSIASRGG